MEKTMNKEVWGILNHDEQTAITLSLAHGKSTWESGEIMSKAHFKYLEIQKRARKFLEMFTNHFEKYSGLFTEEMNISFAFKEYLQLTMVNRLNISNATKKMEDPTYLVASKRNKFIAHELTRLKKANNIPSSDLYNLIMDFDRWNNFRILPIEIQEPSAFKRRNKSRNKKHLKVITTLPKFSVLKLIEKYSYSGKYSKVYLPVISQYLDGNFKIVKVKKNITLINEITNIGLFIFDKEELALDFAKLISDYFLNGVMNCRTGQKFWPEFRVLIKRAINYGDIENIHKSRTYLDKALFDQDEQLVETRKRKQFKGEERIDDEELFYPLG